MKSQRALKEAIAPKRRLGSVRAPPIRSMKLPRSSARGLPTPLLSLSVEGDGRRRRQGVLAPWSRPHSGFAWLGLKSGGSLSRALLGRVFPQTAGT